MSDENIEIETEQQVVGPLRMIGYVEPAADAAPIEPVHHSEHGYDAHESLVDEHGSLTEAAIALLDDEPPAYSIGARVTDGTRTGEVVLISGGLIRVGLGEGDEHYVSTERASDWSVVAG